MRTENQKLKAVRGIDVKQCENWLIAIGQLACGNPNKLLPKSRPISKTLQLVFRRVASACKISRERSPRWFADVNFLEAGWLVDAENFRKAEAQPLVPHTNPWATEVMP